MEVQYSSNRIINSEQFIDLLKKTTLGARRPLDDEQCIAGMLEYADLLVTAWVEDQLVGVARSLTDFNYCCYLSDLAVHQDYQKQGIGQELIQLTQRSVRSGCRLILLAAPQAEEYYPKIGFKRNLRCWSKV